MIIYDNLRGAFEISFCFFNTWMVDILHNVLLLRIFSQLCIQWQGTSSLKSAMGEVIYTMETGKVSWTPPAPSAAEDSC